tara:strand:+ start:602 stop:1501 length:900 start_codon:yes stop_codon:yes gene_type:complete
MYTDKDYSLYDGIPKEFYKLKNKIFDDWEIPPWEILINSNQLLGKGKFGKVYLAEWRKTLVAVKVINNEVNENNKKKYIQEFDTMSKTHHPNVVQLLGYVAEPFVIVMEYLSNGNLNEYISKNKISIEKKIDISINILRGLAYLHNRKPKILIHRDIKTKNILISPSGIPKISDFGLSKFVSDSNLKESNSLENMSKLQNIDSDLSYGIGTIRYMSPEMLNLKDYNCKIDIWSVGIILAELFEKKIYNDKFKWKKTPKNIQDIIIKYMLRENESDRLNALELISLFESISVKKSLFNWT